ncbi:helix-turn-helix domain-containing protein [Arthrobacter sp.]|uniref:helix-turn-helix domain-containing protein n=1 Tax=Arthrobacter sp. TaxID=1667 RepID=UPI003A90E00F
MTTKDAAAALDTDVKTVRAWVASGRLPLAGRAGRSFLLDPASVQRLAGYSRRRGPGWAHQTAWAAIDLMAGGSAEWLIPQNRSRLRTALRDSTMDADRMHALARNRSTVHRYRGHRSISDHLTREVLSTGSAAIADDQNAALRFGLATGHRQVDGYVGAGTAEALAKAFALTTDPAGDIVLREADLMYVPSSEVAPIAAIALDLMDSLSTRERSAGERVLDELLDGFRGA